MNTTSTITTATNEIGLGFLREKRNRPYHREAGKIGQSRGNLSEAYVFYVFSHLLMHRLVYYRYLVFNP